MYISVYAICIVCMWHVYSVCGMFIVCVWYVYSVCMWYVYSVCMCMCIVCVCVCGMYIVCVEHAGICAHRSKVHVRGDCLSVSTLFSSTWARVPVEPEEGVCFWGAGVAGGCKPANMVALKRQVVLDTEPHLWHFHPVFLRQGLSLNLAC